MRQDKSFEFARTLLSIAISLALAFAIIALSSKEPLAALRYFIIGPLDSASHIGNIIEMAIPLVFTGLYYSILFKSNLFNLGAEGLFFSSGLLSGMLGVATYMPPGLHPFVLILAGGLLGALLGLIPCAINYKWGASTLVVSLMMNSILYGICMFLLNNKFRDVSSYTIVTEPFQATAKLARIIPGTRVHAGAIIAIACCVFLYLFLNRTKWGYELRMLGANKHFAEYSGMGVASIMFLAHAISGALAGIGGSVEVLGMYSKFQWTSLPGYGLDGALIALLAKSNPAVVPFAALFIAYIRNGADMMARLSDVPAEMVALVQAAIILLISSQALLKGLRERSLLSKLKGENANA